MLLLLATLAQAACPAGPSAVKAGALAVEQAFAALDKPGVAAAARQLEALTACLSAPIDPALAVRVHAAAGLAAFVEGAPDRAATAFAAARRIDPAWAPDPALVPKGHPIRALATQVDPTTLGALRVPAPAEGALLFDGVPARTRPDGAATVAQWVVDERVVSGGYVWPGGDLPPYDIAGGGSKQRGDPALGPWLGVAGGGVLASGVCFFLAGRARGAWEGAETGPELVARYRENNVAVGLGATFGVIAAVGGVGAVASVAF